MRRLALLLAVALVASLPAWAGTITWDFNSGAPTYAILRNTDVGNTPYFPSTSGPSLLLSAAGYSYMGSCSLSSSSPCYPYPNQDIYYKWSGAGNDETGLGFANEGDHEISGGYLMAFSLPSGYNQVSFTIGSLQDGESFTLFGFEFGGATAPGTALGTWTGNGSDDSLTVTVPYYDTLSIIGGGTMGGKDVLVQTISATTTTPEPASLALLGSALLLLGLVAWKRRRIGAAAPFVR